MMKEINVSAKEVQEHYIKGLERLLSNSLKMEVIIKMESDDNRWTGWIVSVNGAISHMVTPSGDVELLRFNEIVIRTLSEHFCTISDEKRSEILEMANDMAKRAYCMGNKKTRMMMKADKVNETYAKKLAKLLSGVLKSKIEIEIAQGRPVSIVDDFFVWNIRFNDSAIRMTSHVDVDLEEFSMAIIDIIYRNASWIHEPKESVTTYVKAMLKSLCEDNEDVRIVEDDEVDVKKSVDIMDKADRVLSVKRLKVYAEEKFNNVINNDEPKHDSISDNDTDTLQALAVEVVINKYLNEITNKFNHINPKLFTVVYEVKYDDRIYFTITNRQLKFYWGFVIKKDVICLQSIKDLFEESITSKNNKADIEVMEFLDNFDKMMNDLILDSYIDYTNPYIARDKDYPDKKYNKLAWNHFIINILTKFNKATAVNREYIRKQIKEANCFRKIKKAVMEDDIYEFTEDIFEGYTNEYGLVIIIRKDKVTVGLISSISKSYGNTDIDSADFICQIDIPYQLTDFITDYNEAIDIIFIMMMKAAKLDD